MKCFYHDDMDGLCSAAIVTRQYPGIECIKINYGWDFPWESIEPNEDIIMVDFSLPIGDMERLSSLANLTWIDHHKTAINAYNDSYVMINGLRRVGDAGCELTWEHFFINEEMPTIVQLVGDYDLYKSFNNKTFWNSEVYPLQMGLKALSPSEILPNSSLWEKTLSNDDTILAEIKRYGVIIVNYQTEQDTHACINGAFELDWKGYKFCAMNKRGNSIMFKSVYETDRHDGVLTFTWTNSNLWTISIYSDKPHLDFTPIAKEFGGGGHANACGFEVQDLPFNIN